MDKRIVEDLLKNKTTNDVRLLRAIRRAGKTDDDGYCKAQWELYQRFIDEGLSRKEVFQLSGKEKAQQKTKIEVKFLPRRIEVDLPKKYSLAQRKELKLLIKKQMEEILAQFESE